MEEKWVDRRDWMRFVDSHLRTRIVSRTEANLLATICYETPGYYTISDIIRKGKCDKIESILTKDTNNLNNLGNVEEGSNLSSTCKIELSLVNSLHAIDTRFILRVVNHTASKPDKRRSSLITIVRQLIEFLQIRAELLVEAKCALNPSEYIWMSTYLVLIECTLCFDKSHLRSEFDRLS